MALASGASGYLLKTSEHHEICDALRAVARGEVLFSGELHAALAQDIRAREQGSDRPFLSDREQDVLRFDGCGKVRRRHRGRPVLERCHDTQPPAKRVSKLGVSDRAAAVAKAMRLGLIE